MMKTVRLGACMVGLVALAATAAVAAPASADTTPASATDSFARNVGATFLDNQMKLGDLKTWITTQPGWQAAGYVDQVNDAAHLSTKLLWAGDSPLREQAVAKAKSLGISASIEERPLTLPQIFEAQRKIEASKDRLAAAGFTLTGVIGVQEDTTDLVATGTFTSAPATTRQRQTVTSSVDSTLDSIAGVPVTLNAGVKTAPAVGRTTAGSAKAAAVSTRQSDAAPHSAGALMSSGGEICSSGLSVVLNGTEGRATTARHCDQTATWSPVSGGGSTFGKKAQNSPNGAATMLTARGTNLAYDGEWDNSVGYSKLVAKNFTPSLNDLVCTGGGNSGEHCNIKVTSTAYAWNDGFGSVLTFLGTQQTAGGIADIQGDSGGPLIALYGVQSGQVAAAGMIQGIFSDSTHPFMTGSKCGRAYSLGSNQCSAIGIFTSMTQIVDRWSGVTVNTN